MSALSAARLAGLIRDRRPAVGVGLPAGFPDLTAGARVLEAAVRGARADFIELGLPHVDPVADTPDMAQAHVRARREEASVPEVLAVVDQLSVLVPIVVPAYFSSVLSYGMRRFAEDLAYAGGAGARIVDLPEDEAVEWHAVATSFGLLTPRFVTRGASSQRLGRLAQASGGWLHVPAGPTPPFQDGALELGELRPVCRRLREHGAELIACGGDIADAGMACTIAPWVDALVIDSAIVRCLLDQPGGGGAQDAVEHVRTIRRSLADVQASAGSASCCDDDSASGSAGGAA